MKRLFLVVASLAATSAFAGQKAVFVWGNYDKSLYEYSKHPEKLPDFEADLRSAIYKGRANGRIAPGLQAELGYCLLGEGKKTEAVELFKAEMALYPESSVFMTKMITQAEAGT